MKVKSMATVTRTPGTTYAERQTTVKVTVEISDAQRGDPVVGTLDRGWAGALKTVATALDRS